MAAAISHLDSGLQMGRPARSSPNGPFISGALDSADSVRFSKFECFERLMDCSEVGFFNSSRTGNSIRFRIVIGSNPPAPANHCHWPGFPKRPAGRKSRLFTHSVWSPNSWLAEVEEEIAESLRAYPQTFPFCGDYWRRLVRSPLPPEGGIRFPHG